MIFLHLMLGPLLLCLAFLYKFRPPKKVNSFYGYRTKRSMASQDAWDAANKFSADILIWVAIATAAIQIISFFYLEKGFDILIPTFFMTSGIVAMIFLTEKFLRNQFDKAGNRI